MTATKKLIELPDVFSRFYTNPGPAQLRSSNIAYTETFEINAKLTS